MDGLECSEVSFTKLNGELRYDSEYYQKRYIFEDVTLMRYKKEIIGNVAFVTDGQHGYHEIDEHSSIHMLTAKNAKNWFANLQGAEPLAKWVDDNNKRSSLEEGDIILSTRGTVGNCAIVMADILPANIDQDVARIKLMTTTFEKEFVITYLNSIYGQDWMKRNQTGMVQQGLSLQKVCMIPIPVLCEDFQTKVKNIVFSAYSAYKQSQNTFIKAEQILMDELGVTDFTPSAEKISVKNFADSFGACGRLDAEFYQKKYDQIETAIAKYHGGYVKFGDCIKYIFTGEYAEQYYTAAPGLKFYIRSTNMNHGQIDIDSEYYVSPQAFTKSVTEGDIITARVGTIGKFAEVEENLNDAICSDNVICFRFPDEYNPSVYTLLLNSKIMFELIDRLARGSVQQRLNQETLKDLIVPIISPSIQLKIADKIQESFFLRKQSDELLVRAKQAVEMAIEKDEQTALDWLASQE